MATIETKAIMICSDCGKRIMFCDKCGECLRVGSMLGTEIMICRDGKHYHTICKITP